MEKDIEYRIVNPDNSISDFVERFWMLQNLSNGDKETIVIPDGRFDIIFTRSPNEPFTIGMIGIETMPSKHTLPAGTLFFGVSLKLLAVEYLLDTSISALINEIQQLPDGFWGITENDLNDFEGFCKKATNNIRSNVKPDIDDRKRQLFNLIYTANGSLTVHELSEKVYWGSRQINRYFNQKFGISLKAFCNTLRFRASFTQIKKGNLFPGLEFSDQAHFIKEVKKYTGVSPKELFKNQNDRFIQFSTLGKP